MSRRPVSFKENVLHPSRSLRAAEWGGGFAVAWFLADKFLEDKVEGLGQLDGRAAHQIIALRHENQAVVKLQKDAHASGNYTAEAFLAGERVNNDQLIASVEAQHPGARESTVMDDAALLGQDGTAFVSGALVVAVIATAVQRRR